MKINYQQPAIKMLSVVAENHFGASGSGAPFDEYEGGIDVNPIIVEEPIDVM